MSITKTVYQSTTIDSLVKTIKTIEQKINAAKTEGEKNSLETKLSDILSKNVYVVLRIGGHNASGNIPGVVYNDQKSVIGTLTYSPKNAENIDLL